MTAHRPYSPTPTVMAFHNYKPRGHTIPHTWYRHITFENGKPDLVAIHILADVFYWYKPKVMVSRVTGQVTRIKAKFAEDKLRRSFKYYMDLYKITDDQARAAVARLVKKGLLLQFFRHVHGEDGRIIAKPMYLEPVPEEIKKLDEIPAPTAPIDPTDEEPLDDDDDLDDEDEVEAEPSPIQNGGGYPSPIPTATVSALNPPPSPIQSGDMIIESAHRIPTENSPPTPQGETGAAHAAGGANAPGGEADGAADAGETGDAPNGATGAPDGAGDRPPRSARPPKAPPTYPETIAWLDEKGCETADRWGEWPLPIVQKRYASKQRFDEPIRGLVADMKKRPITEAEWAWYEAQRDRPTEPGVPTAPPEMREDGGIDHVRNNRLRELLLPALHRLGLDVDWLTVLAWPTPAEPLLVVHLPNAEADALFDELTPALLPALVAVGVDPQLNLEIETRWGILRTLPKPPPLVEPEAPAPSRAVERDASQHTSATKIPPWANRSAWALVPLRLQLVLQHVTDVSEGWPRGTALQQKLLNAPDVEKLPTRSAISELLRRSGITPRPPGELADEPAAGAEQKAS